MLVLYGSPIFLFVHPIAFTQTKGLKNIPKHRINCLSHSHKPKIIWMTSLYSASFPVIFPKEGLTINKIDLIILKNGSWVSARCSMVGAL